MGVSISRTCGTCKYWDNEHIKDFDDDNPDIGECTRYPPVIVTTKPLSGRGLKKACKIDAVTSFPVTSCMLTCGEWSLNKR